MSTDIQRRPCPYCAEMIAVNAIKCRFCGEDLHDEDDDYEPPREARNTSGGVEATDFLIPTNVSGWSIASCYMGLIGFFLPFIGLAFTIPGLIFGIIALKKRKKGASSYGAVTSDVRAIIGVIACGLSIVLHVVLLVFVALAGILKQG